MTEKTTELFTPYTQEVALAEPRPPKVVNIVRKDGRYCLDAFSRYWPLPARWDGLWRWLRGRRVWTLALAAVVALAAVGAGVVWVVRFLGRATR